MAIGTGRADPLQIPRSALAPGATPLGPAIREAERMLKEFDAALDRRGFVDSAYKIPERQVIGGQISNLQAQIYQASRHTKETIVEIGSSPATKGEVADWIAGLAGNRGHFSLSVTAHVRATQRLGVWQMIQAQVSDPRKRITHVAPVVPSSSEGSIRAKGTLMRYLGGVFNVRDWLGIARGHNKQRAGLSLAFSLGLHHGDPSYLVPISLEKLAVFRAALKNYRRELRKRVERRDR